jgi:hypothetical protein
MSREDSRARDNYNRHYARRDNEMSPYEGGMRAGEVRKNYIGGDSKYHKDVAEYAKKRGKTYGGGHEMHHHGEGKPHKGTE